MLNKIFLQGRLTDNPNYKTTTSGTAFCMFTVAVERNFKDKQSGKYDADFIRCNAYGHSADFINRYFTKGNPIVLEGSMRNNNYTDSQGVKHFSDVVVVDRVYFNVGGNSVKEVPNSTQTNPQAVITDAKAAGIDMDSLDEFEDIISDEGVPF